MSTLAARCPELHVPAPIPTRLGRLSTRSGDAPIALFPFVAGNALPSALAAGQQRRLGRAIATLHRSTDSLSDVPLARETFTLPFESVLRAALTTGAVPEDARARLVPRAADVLDALDDVVTRAAALRSYPAVFVVCHTDMAGDNVIVRDDGTLAILDWDETLVAPAEADLWDLDPATLVTYLDAGGVADIDAGRLTFYARRRAIEDMAARVVRLSNRATPPASRAKLVTDIDEWGFERLDAVAARVDALMSGREPRR